MVENMRVGWTTSTSTVFAEFNIVVYNWFPVVMTVDIVDVFGVFAEVVAPEATGDTAVVGRVEPEEPGEVVVVGVEPEEPCEIAVVGVEPEDP